jgi:hypothetical protein
LSIRRRYGIYAVALAVWITGVGWLVFHYFLKQVDEFGFDAAHPAEKWWLIGHAVVAFYALWWFGLLWTSHVLNAWKARVRRGSGGALFACTAWLALTGCALYYIGSELWRACVSILHWAVGIAAVAAFIYHLQARTARAGRPGADRVPG